tara:strand:- start:465 stop:794 length:330 start_codon:yes stop_codon:yes gene_type:complete
MATCSEEEVHLNDIGTVFLVTVNDCVAGTSAALDVSTASTLELVFKSPSGSASTKTASLNTDGTDGKIYYTTVDGDINQIGTWRIQAKIGIGGGTFRSDVGSFKVYENL